MLVEAAITYKVEWDRGLERRRIHDLDLPSPIPHPDDIVVDLQTGKVHFKEPMTKEEKAEWDLWTSHKQGFIDELAFLQEKLEKSTSEFRRAEIMQDIKQTIRVLEILENFENSRKVIT